MKKKYVNGLLKPKQFEIRDNNDYKIKAIIDNMIYGKRNK